MFADTDSKQQKIKILKVLIDLEFPLSQSFYKRIPFGTSEDFERYTKMGLQLNPNAAVFNYRNGKHKA